MRFGGHEENLIEDLWTIITPTLSRGPFPKRTRALAAALTRRGIAVDVLYLEHLGHLLSLPSNVNVHALGGRARGSVPQIARHLRNRKPEVVLSIGFLMNVPCLIASLLIGYRGVLLVNEVSIPTSAGMVDWPKGFTRRIAPMSIYNTLHARSDAIVCVSESTKAALDDILLFNRIRRKLTVIANPVELNSQVRSPTVDLPRESHGDPLFLNLGRLVPMKRIDLSIVAFSVFVARNGVGQLLIAGEGDEEANLRQLASELGIADRVHFVGYVENSEALLATATLLLHLAHSEGFGMAVAEALTVGTPVVVAQGSGGPEGLIGKGGLAVQPDPQSVSGAMHDIWHNGARMRSMREGALIAAEQFSPDLVADKWIALASDIRSSGSD